MGESFGAYRLGDDAGLLPWVSSVNVACGFHAGDPRVMARTVAAAHAAGVAIGAHPGFPDLVGFGRRTLAVSAEEATTDVLYQIGALDGFCRAVGTRLWHVKPHGQLYNQAAVDRELAQAIATAVHSYHPGLILVAPGGALAEAGRQTGLTVALEGFADRAYQADGRLVPRARPGAVIADPEAVVRRAIRMVRDGTVETIAGTTLPITVHTLCVHGDTPGAAELARRLRQGLEAAGVAVRPLAEVLASNRR